MGGELSSVFVLATASGRGGCFLLYFSLRVLCSSKLTSSAGCTILHDALTVLISATLCSPPFE